MRPPLPTAWLAMLLVLGCGSTKPRGDAAPLAREADLELYAETYGFSLGHPRSIEVVPGDESVLFLRSGPRSPDGELWALDTRTGQERRLLTASQVLAGAEQTLSPEERARRERSRTAATGIASYSLDARGQSILLPLSGRLFVFDRATSQVRELSGSDGFPIDPRFSPDGKLVACVRNGDVHVLDVAAGTERRVTKREADHVTYGLAEFVAQEEMERQQGLWWSPDSRSLLVQRNDSAAVEELRVQDPAKPWEAGRTERYPRAGTPNVRVGLVHVSLEDLRAVEVDWSRGQYEYLATVKWANSASPPTLVVQNRRQSEAAVLSVAPSTGATKPLLVERDETWLNLDQSVPLWLPDGSGFLWSSERGGAWQIELRGPDGKLQRTLATLAGYERVLDIRGGEAWLLALAGSEQHVLRVALDGGGAPTRVTTTPGLHMASLGERLWVHAERPRAGGRVVSVRRLPSEEGPGTEIARIASVAASPSYRPDVEWLEVGERAFQSVVVRPRDFRRGIRYPVLVYVYGGPHHRVADAWLDRYLVPQWLADHGFVVVMADVRGTPGRGRAFERVIAGDVITQPLADQVEVLQTLGRRFPEMDLARVGVYGWSFGGYFAAMAVMRRPDVFHAAVAVAPVADWRDYDTHYTERYMGLPNENVDGYQSTSLLSHAKSLTRPLLLVHGTVDDNVYFMHTLRLSDALFRAGRPHAVLPLSGFTHMVHGKEPTTRLWSRVAGFFERELSGAAGEERR